MYSNIKIFLQKRKNWKTHVFINIVVSQKVLKLQRRTIPHFKALDQLFWPLAWLLTLGAMVFEVWSKMSVRIIFAHPLLKQLFVICTYPNHLPFGENIVVEVIADSNL